MSEALLKLFDNPAASGAAHGSSAAEAAKKCRFTDEGAHQWIYPKRGTHIRILHVSQPVFVSVSACSEPGLKLKTGLQPGLDWSEPIRK